MATEALGEGGALSGGFELSISDPNFELEETFDRGLTGSDIFFADLIEGCSGIELFTVEVLLTS